MKHAFTKFCDTKIVEPEKLEEFVAGLRSVGKKIATLNGSFDLMHSGHLFMIYEAAQVADCLIVAANSDESIRGYKSKDRPIIPLRQRMEMLAALSFVDYVTWFDELDPRKLLSIIKPDVHVNGIEYGENCIEAPVVRSYGGKLHLVERLPGLATSDIINKIKCV